MEFSLDLTEKEKLDIKISLNFLLTKEIERFVITFYESYLKPETLKFIQKTTNESLINMFTSFLNIITSYFIDSTLLDEHIEVLLDKHKNFKDLISHSEVFTQAFMYALKTSLGKEFNEESTQTWYNLISKLISYINQSQ